MLNRLERLAQRVGGSNRLIDDWLKARKQLLVEYYLLVGLKPQKEKHTPLNEKALSGFCQQLVDYLSACHFHLYDKIIVQTKEDPQTEKVLANRLYPKLHDNTLLMMQFYDRYSDSQVHDELCLELHDALSEIGEHMATRFAWEDQLILLAAESPDIKQPENLKQVLN